MKPALLAIAALGVLVLFGPIALVVVTAPGAATAAGAGYLVAACASVEPGLVLPSGEVVSQAQADNAGAILSTVTTSPTSSEPVPTAAIDGALVASDLNNVAEVGGGAGVFGAPSSWGSQSQLLDPMQATQFWLGHLPGSWASENPAQLAEDVIAGGLVSGDSNADLQAFLAAIRRHESGGDYTSHPGNGASGAYGYIDSTWTSQAIDAGLGAYAHQEPWQVPPAIQDAVAAHNAKGLYKTYGNWKDTAEAWYYPAWAGDPSKQNSVPVPSAGNTQTIGAFGDQIVSWMTQILQGGSPGTDNPYSAHLADAEAIVTNACNGGILTAAETAGSSTTPPGSYVPPPGTSPAAASAVSAALGQLGAPYVFAGETPGVGFDCSGLVQWAWAQAGVSIARTTYDEVNDGTSVPVEGPYSPGDLIFIMGSDPMGSLPGHVGLYVGSGMLVDAPFTGRNVEEIPVSDWGGLIVAVRHIG